MKIDWNVAPDWAIGHGLIVQGAIKQVWYGEQVYMVIGDSRSYCFGGGTGETRLNHMQDAIQFKTLRPAPWAGEGLPPVGTVCEFKSTQHDGPHEFEPVEVMYTSKVTVVVKRLDADRGMEEELLCHPGTAKFRPIRTPEQIAAEERLKAVAEMEACRPFIYTDDKQFCFALYDAGYRKQAKP